MRLRGSYAFPQSSCLPLFLYIEVLHVNIHHTIENLSSTRRPKKWTGVIVLLVGF